MHGIGAAALVALLAIAQLNCALAGVKTLDTGIQYPGQTGLIPAACDGGVNEAAHGAPSMDLSMSDPRMIKSVAGNTPEQVHLTQGRTPSTMYISWTTGNASYNFCGDGVKNGDVANQCIYNQGVAQKVPTAVKYGVNQDLRNAKTSAFAYHYPDSQQYLQIYGPQGAGQNYTGPYIHHVRLTGLKPETTYYYKVGDGDTFSTKTYSFTTLPAPGTKPRKPTRIALTADMGTTYATAEVLSSFTEGNNPDVVLLVGDHTYADNHNNDQRWWDAWFRLIEPSASHVPWIPSLGNHEEETQWTDCIVNALVANGGCGNLTTAAQIKAVCGNPSPAGACPCYSSSFGGLEKGGLNPNFVWNNCNGKSAFTSATARWPTPHDESGSSSNHYYAVKFGLVYVIVLSSYQPYCGGSLPCAIYQPGINVGPTGNSPQYEWLARELKKIDKTETPWVVVTFHNPWYTTWGGFKTDDCPRQALEPLLKAANVDFFFNGHIHAYERSNPVYNFNTDPTGAECDPVHIVIGDAGNDETLNCPLIDRGTTNKNGLLDCTGQQLAKNKTEGYYFPCTSHTFQDSPYFCKKNDQRVDTSVYPASFYGCQELGYCPNKQPITSAYRSSAYGSGLLEIVDEKTAIWKWNGFVRAVNMTSGYEDGGTEMTAMEQVTFTRCDPNGRNSA